jgi:hypothetical protein
MLKKYFIPPFFAILFTIFSWAEAFPQVNAGYRLIQIQDTITNESFPVGLWYPTQTQPIRLELGPYFMEVARDKWAKGDCVAPVSSAVRASIIFSFVQ